MRGLQRLLHNHPAWTRDPLWTRARMVPSFDIDANWGALPIDRVSGLDLTTFTRAASATYVDSDGSIKTAGTNVLRRQWDATNRRWGWLVEATRSNLLQWSETLSTQSVTVAATAYTLSFYGTGSVTRSGTSTGTTNGISATEPVSVTFTPTAGSLTLTVSGSVKFANLEAGSFRTSWIPTTGTTATRDADAWTVTGSNFSRWYRQDEGTLFAEFGPYGNAGGSKNPGVIQIDNGSDANTIRMFCGGSISPVFQVRDSSATQAYRGTGTLTPSVTSKMSGTYKVNDVAIAVNGSNLLTDNAGTVPTVTQMLIGTGSAGVIELSGAIRRLTYWPTRLPNPTIQSLAL